MEKIEEELLEFSRVSLDLESNTLYSFIEDIEEMEEDNSLLYNNECSM